MKLLQPVVFALFFLFQFSTSTSVLAFQLADAAPPAPAGSERFILYWGKFQCDLNQSNNYHGNLELTVADFRQIMLSPPKVWNGKGINTFLKFKLEDFDVSTETYLNQLAQMDAWLSPKLKPNTTIRLHDLTLAEGVSGNIDIRLETDETPDLPAFFGNSPRQLGNYMNDQMVEHVAWGREDIMETSNRDFFTIREIWQTLRQEPAVIWLGPNALPLRATVTFVSPNQTSYSVVSELDVQPYPEFLNSLELFSYMVQAGSTVALSLETVGQYELIYKKTMRVVGNDDPRLRLRRFRDLHRVVLHWGEWQENLSTLYLHDQTAADGSRVAADQPVSLNTSVSFGERADSLASIFGNFPAPEFELDGDAWTAPFSFRVTVSDSLVMTVGNTDYSMETVHHFFEKAPQDARIRIDSVHMEGFDFPPSKITIIPFLLKNPLLAKNDLGVLNKLSENGARVRLKDPEIKKDSLVFEFELLEKTKMALSIFNPDGWNDYNNTDTFNSGIQTIEVPLGVFKDKGKHFAFLNTPFGVSKVEFDVP